MRGKGNDKAAAGSARSTKLSRLRDLYPEARRQLTPLFSQAENRADDTLMYLAISQLHRLYPELSPVELEVLFSDVMRQMGEPPPQA